MIRLLKRPLSLLLLPLSVLPILLVVPQIQASQRNFERTHQSGPLPVAAFTFTPGQLQRYQPMAPTGGKIPVLAYRGVNDSRDGFSVSRARLSGHLALLERLGFESITIDQYLAAARGETAGLPERPVLITFDGARLDSYRGADLALARYGMRATMFVPTRSLDDAAPGHLMWSEIKRMSESGRWSFGVAGADADRMISADLSGRMGPFYGTRRFTSSEGLEDIAAFERRVSADVFEAVETLATHGLVARSIAVPFSDYGQRSSTDARVPRLMGDLLHRQFEAVFLSDERNVPPYSTPGEAEPRRFEVHTDTTVDRLFMWLRDHHPSAARPDPTHDRRR